MELLAIGLTLLMAGVLLWIGHQIAVQRMRAEWRQLDHQKALLAVERQQLDHTARMRSIFLAARWAMQAATTDDAWQSAGLDVEGDDNQ